MAEFGIYSSEVWLRTDELGDLVDSLEQCAELSNALDNPKTWKWLIIALHGAVQSACVCSLRGIDTSGVAVLDKRSGAAVWKWLDVEHLTITAPTFGHRFQPDTRQRIQTSLSAFRAKLGDWSARHNLIGL